MISRCRATKLLGREVKSIATLFYWLSESARIARLIRDINRADYYPTGLRRF